MIICYDMTCCIPNGEGYWPKGIKSLHDVANVVRKYLPNGPIKVYRRYTIMAPTGADYHHTSGFTHAWHIDRSGHVDYAVKYTRPWSPFPIVGKM